MKNLLYVVCAILVAAGCGDGERDVELEIDAERPRQDTELVVDVDQDTVVERDTVRITDTVVQRERGDDAPPTFEGSPDPKAGGGDRHGTATLTDVRVATHEYFDRLVFQFEGEGLPRWNVEYVDKPVHECGSGKQRFPRGDGYLQVRFSGAAAHTDDGRPTISARDRTLQQGGLRQLMLTCDFEGEVTWVAGLASPNPIRVLQLEDPARLVIDVRKQR